MGFGVSPQRRASSMTFQDGDIEVFKLLLQYGDVDFLDTSAFSLLPRPLDRIRSRIVDMFILAQRHSAEAKSIASLIKGNSVPDQLRGWSQLETNLPMASWPTDFRADIRTWIQIQKTIPPKFILPIQKTIQPKFILPIDVCLKIKQLLAVTWRDIYKIQRRVMAQLPDLAPGDSKGTRP